MNRCVLYCSKCGGQVGYIYGSMPIPWVECVECGEDEIPEYPDGPEFDGWEERSGL